MKIFLKDIGYEGLSINENTDAGKLETDTVIFRDVINIQGHITQTGNNYFLNVILKTTATLECETCLENYFLSLSPELSIVYFPDGSVEANMQNENWEFYNPNSDTLDIAPVIRDYLELEIPQKRLCKDDCRGLCPSCGVNLNTDKCDCTQNTGNKLSELLAKINLNQE